MLGDGCVSRASHAINVTGSQNCPPVYLSSYITSVLWSVICHKWANINSFKKLSQLSVSGNWNQSLHLDFFINARTHIQTALSGSLTVSTIYNKVDEFIISCSSDPASSNKAAPCQYTYSRSCPISCFGLKQPFIISLLRCWCLCWIRSFQKTHKGCWGPAMMQDYHLFSFKCIQNTF